MSIEEKYYGEVSLNDVLNTRGSSMMAYHSLTYITENFGVRIYMCMGACFNNPRVKESGCSKFFQWQRQQELKDKPQRRTLIVAMSLGLARTNS